MRIALVHDYIKEYGGAERVLETLHEVYPEAPIYTSLYLPEFLGPHRSRFEKMDIRTSFFQYIPFNHKLLSPFRLIAAFAFYLFDFSKYDVVIVSQTGAYFPNSIRKKGARQICYTHTPPRYLYGYKTARDIPNNFFFKGLMLVIFHFLRMIDFASSKNVDTFIANSNEVKARIEKFYRRDAEAVYPPIEIPNSKLQIPNKLQKAKSNKPLAPYYLAGGRLARAKGIDVIIDAFLNNNKKLKVFGRGFAGFEEHLKSLIVNHKSTIQFVGEVNDEEKLRLMKNAKGYIFASYDEDFGITPVEAMGQGTPVIAFKSGGVKETIVDGKTGIFYNKNTAESLNNAIDKLEGILKQVQDDKMKEWCVQQAQKFEKKKFVASIRKIVEEM